ncbi:hypothetical protein BGZ61DRAFT_137084 [Ilyonectria robusta]|uniref:uncharacterized protein n=1 Tax=Ilyonectria robusta TaxID=1079257 RepID=UPI001E8E3910|nr:uncharacterized protein BGZ61DRAFT_137084 [Ilyonectria robusta]KAH8735217.1 hypothetical protein BGZ61DRAFT_137084 [Ilyonectria robusta]
MPDGLLRGSSFRVGFFADSADAHAAPSLRLVSPVHSATGSWCSASMIGAPVRLDDDARVSDSSSSAPQTSNAGDDEAGSRRPTSFFPPGCWDLSPSFALSRLRPREMLRPHWMPSGQFNAQPLGSRRLPARSSTLWLVSNGILRRDELCEPWEPKELSKVGVNDAGSGGYQ